MSKGLILNLKMLRSTMPTSFIPTAWWARGSYQAQTIGRHMILLGMIEKCQPHYRLFVLRIINQNLFPGKIHPVINPPPPPPPPGAPWLSLSSYWIGVSKSFALIPNIGFKWDNASDYYVYLWQCPFFFNKYIAIIHTIPPPEIIIGF